MLDCAPSFVTAVYPKICLSPQDVRAVPQGAFTQPFSIRIRHFLIFYGIIMFHVKHFSPLHALKGASLAAGRRTAKVLSRRNDKRVVLVVQGPVKREIIHEHLLDIAV